MIKKLSEYMNDKRQQKLDIERYGKCACCPAGYEDRGYEGEVYDCGCLLNGEFNDYCKLPFWLVRLFLAFED